MLEMLTVTLFLLVAAGIAWAGLRKGTWRTRGVLRVAPPPGHAASLSVPQHRVIAPGTLRALIRAAGMSVEEFVARM